MIEESARAGKAIQVLEFERPIADLEKKIEELPDLSTASMDFSAVIPKLQLKPRNLQQDVFS